MTAGVIAVWGPVDHVALPYLVLPLTVEPTKPRLCHDERYLNLWIRDLPFKLDYLCDLPRYVLPHHFQTTFDDKNGYQHVLLHFLVSGLFWLSVAGFLFRLPYSSIRLEGQCVYLSQVRSRGFRLRSVHWGSSVTVH